MTVFVVDDDVSVRKSTGRLLMSAGYDVVICASAAEFLSLPDRPRPSCLLTDLRMRRADQPDQPVKWPGWENTVQYATMDLGGTELMASDVPPDHFQPMRSVYLTLTADSAAEAERLWAVLSDGGQILMRLQETFFATRFGQVRDKFRTSWMIMALEPR